MARLDLFKYLTPKAIVNLSVILGLLVFAVWTLIFLGNEIESRSSLIREERTEINTRARMIAELAELREESVEAETATLVLQSVVPTRDKLLLLPKHVEQLGSKSEITANVSFTGKEVLATEGGAGNNAFRVGASGSFNNTLEFIESLESTEEFFIKLESIDIVRVDRIFNTTISGLVYFYD